MSNTPLAPIDGLVSSEHHLFERLYVQLRDDYSQLKLIFNAYAKEMEKRPVGWLRRRNPAGFTEIISAMASSGIKMDQYAINELYAHYGGELKPFALDRMHVLEEFAVRTGIVPHETAIKSHLQWVALDKTERWFARESVEAVRNQVTARSFGDRYNLLARAVYHLLRRELGRKPNGEDLRDAIQSSAAVDGKQEEVAVWLSQLVP